MPAAAKKENPAQLTFQVFCPPIITANGDGFTVKPGKPLVALTARQLGSYFDRSAETVHRWRSEGIIPERFIRYAGRRQLLFAADLIPFLEEQFRAGHE